MKRGMVGVVVAVFLALCSACGVQGAPASFAAVEQPRTISVFGQGRVTTPADVVDVTVVVEAVRPRLDLAYKRLQLHQVQLVKALSALNVGPGDIVALSYESTPDGVPLEDGALGARMRQWLGITVRDVSLYSKIIGAIIDSEQRIVDVRFGSTAAGGLEERAHERAVIDARRRALALASELGAHVGRALTIRELAPSEAEALGDVRAGILRPTLDLAPRSQFEVRCTVEASFELTDA